LANEIGRPKIENNHSHLNKRQLSGYGGWVALYGHQTTLNLVPWSMSTGKNRGICKRVESLTVEQAVCACVVTRQEARAVMPFQ
jgi:hypothetical protein